MTSKSRSFDGIIVDSNDGGVSGGIGISDEQVAAIISNTDSISSLSTAISTVISEDITDESVLDKLK